MTDGVQTARLVRALAIVAAVVLAVPALDTVVSAGGIDDADAGAGVGSAALQMVPLDGGGPLSSLDGIERSLDEFSGLPPEGFASEVGLPEGSRDVRVSSSGAVVGCTVGADPDVVLEGVTRQLEEGGWTAVPLGGVVGATFVKQGGAYRWLLVTCTRVGDATSVVYRSVSP